MPPTTSPRPGFSPSPLVLGVARTSRRCVLLQIRERASFSPGGTWVFYYCRRLRFSLPVNCLGNTSERLAAVLHELIIKGGAIIDHETPRERRDVAVEK